MRQFRVVVNGNEYTVAIEELTETGKPANIPQQTREERPSAISQLAQSSKAAPASLKPRANGDSAGVIKAAMPGTILSIKTSVGEAVVRGQALLILEAMKMENEIMAPGDGVIGEIHAKVGASVNSGDVLIVMS